MVIDDAQGVAAMAVLQGEVAVVVHLPELVAVLALKAGEGLVFEGGARVNAAVAFENVGAGFDAGDVGAALGLAEGLDLSSAPGRSGITDGEDEFFDFLRCT